ncbi:helix-turn-helix transcriptional regulator [Streptomyces sp. NPDC050287]|uniref:helix-turn-helix transcriptional regulator n=1 Tax=Streptomyces sp. NPDC050287 TaxID=3365608 RepID=UPI0037B0FCE1
MSLAARAGVVAGLTDAEQHAWRSFVRLQDRLLGRLGREMQAESGLSTADYGVLVELTEVPEGRLRVLELDLGFSLRYLHELFREADTTPRAWLYAQRLDCARAMLSGAGYDAQSISSIALRAGFKDASHFSRAFKSRYGTSPATYRRTAVRAPSGERLIRIAAAAYAQDGHRARPPTALSEEGAARGVSRGRASRRVGCPGSSPS